MQESKRRYRPMDIPTMAEFAAKAIANAESVVSLESDYGQININIAYKAKWNQDWTLESVENTDPAHPRYNFNLFLSPVMPLWLARMRKKPIIDPVWAKMKAVELTANACMLQHVGRTTTFAAAVDAIIFEYANSVCEQKSVVDLVAGQIAGRMFPILYRLFKNQKILQLVKKNVEQRFSEAAKIMLMANSKDESEIGTAIYPENDFDLKVRKIVAVAKDMTYSNPHTTAPVNEADGEDKKEEDEE